MVTVFVSNYAKSPDNVNLWAVEYMVLHMQKKKNNRNGFYMAAIICYNPCPISYLSASACKPCSYTVLLKPCSDFSLQNDLKL